MPINIIFDIETTGLNAMTDKITCISFKKDEDRIISFCGDMEKEILQNFWFVIRNNPGCNLIGSNSDGFDIPFIVKRSIINRVHICKLFNNVDLRKEANSFGFSYNKYEKGSLDDWGKILGFESKFTNGGEVAQLGKEGNYEEVRKHCEYDIEISKVLFDRLREVGVL